MSTTPQSTPGAAPAADPAAVLGRKQMKALEGVVISAKMQKTISVEMERMELHPKYKKYVRRSVRFKVHDEKGEAKDGDVVRFVQTRPISRTKHWRLVEVVSRARQ